MKNLQGIQNAKEQWKIKIKKKIYTIHNAEGQLYSTKYPKGISVCSLVVFYQYFNYDVRNQKLAKATSYPKFPCTSSAGYTVDPSFSPANVALKFLPTQVKFEK